MVFSGARSGANSPGLAPPTTRDTFSTLHSTNNVDQIIREPTPGAYTRQVVTWRLPQLGYIKMFLNPQNIVITEGKDISTTRTKAGFIIQYAGEKLTEISISGITGSAGMEGINILRAVYRSEQLAFEPIASELDRTVLAGQLNQLSQGIKNQAVTQFIDQEKQQSLSQQADDIALNVLSQPFPTLASLAANVEMFFQGVAYRGYFTSFTVTENVESLGHFSYELKYVAYSRQGERRNFMPWHRQPYNPIGGGNADVNPLSFFNPNAFDSVVSAVTNLFLNSSDTGRSDVTASDQGQVIKSIGFSSGREGGSLTAENLEDEVPDF